MCIAYGCGNTQYVASRTRPVNGSRLTPRGRPSLIRSVVATATYPVWKRCCIPSMLRPRARDARRLRQLDQHPKYSQGDDKTMPRALKLTGAAIAAALVLTTLYLGLGVANGKTI